MTPSVFAAASDFGCQLLRGTLNASKRDIFTPESEHLEALCYSASLSSLPLIEQRPLLVEYMRESAMMARDHVFEQEPDSHISKLTRLSSVARAVWAGDNKLMNILCYKSELARSLLSPSSSGPTLKDPSVFESLLLKAKSEHLERQKEELAHEHPDGKHLRNAATVST